jgi:hypothetical protein
MTHQSFHRTDRMRLLPNKALNLTALARPQVNAITLGRPDDG